MTMVRTTLAILVILIAPVLALADSELEPRSYSVASPNGKFLFVMIAPIEPQRDGLYWREQQKQELQRIRASYSISGMYPNDGSTNPMWTVNWYSYSVLVPNDGVHVVRLGPWARSISDEAFTFFENGKQIRTYRIADLVDTAIFLPHTVSHFEWAENINIDDESRKLTVATLSKERYAFDFTTGKLVSARRPLRAILVTAGVVFTLLAVWILAKKGFC